MNESLLEQIIEIDKELEEIFKNTTHGLPERFFKKKLIEKISKKDLYTKTENILMKMNNTDLLIALNVTNYIIKINYIPKYLSEAFVDYKKIKENPDYLIEEYKNVINQKNTIAEMSKSKEYYDLVMSCSNIEKIEKNLLSAMNNEQINELAESSKDWKDKLYFYGFLKDGSVPCKFDKQKDGKYFVVKVKYINVKDENEYLYICNDVSMKKGEKILVTSYTGYCLDIKVAKILDTKYYLEDELPISLNDSEEVIGRVNDDEFNDIKYSFGKLKCFDDDGNQIPFYDPDLDRQCYLSAIKIADDLTTSLSDENIDYLINIPNYELVPKSFKKMIIDEFIVSEPREIRKIDGLEDEIADYLLFNLKNKECFNLTNEIVDKLLNELDEDTSKKLLLDSFEEHNVEFIKYIEKKFVKDNHKKVECEDDWLAKRVFNRLIMNLQKINQMKIYDTKHSNSLFKYNFRDINRKFVTMFDSNEKFDNLGIKDLKNPFVGYVYLDINRGLNVRVIGNLDNKKLIKKLCMDECVIIKSESLLDYESNILDEEIETYDLESQMDKYYSSEGIERGRASEEIDNLRNEEYPDDVLVTFLFDEVYEELWGRLVDYDDGKYLVYLIQNSAEDDKYKKGIYVICSYHKFGKSERLIFEKIY